MINPRRGVLKLLQVSRPCGIRSLWTSGAHRCLRIPQRSLPSKLYFYRTYAVDRLGQDVDSKIDNISAGEYDKISNIYLEDLGDEIDLIAEEHADVDFDLSQGVLTLNTAKGTYVINRQPPNKQIWLSSPLTGPNRYDLVGGKWISLRDNGLLSELLSHELSGILGTSIELQLEQ